MTTNRNQNKSFGKQYDFNAFGGKVTAIFSLLNMLEKN